GLTVPFLVVRVIHQVVLRCSCITCRFNKISLMKEILTILLCSLFITASAQTNTSPYSIVGIGDIDPSYNDHGTGMADASVSLSSPRYIYNANPASLGSLDEHFFSFEVG